jgi:NAD(P)-dependent dehydrogenase (short-subunit alcohol dehydrogenase family)
MAPHAEDAGHDWVKFAEARGRTEKQESRGAAAKPEAGMQRDPRSKSGRRVALVTGGSRGIGLAAAVALAHAGYDVGVSARDAERGAAAVTRIEMHGVSALAVGMDLREPDDVKAAIEAVVATLGPVSVLVNNAGVAEAAPFGRVSLDSWNETFAVNATGPFLATQACLPGMLETGWGRIVNVASVAALRGVAYASHYAASKHALLGLTRSLALEVAKNGITVNCVCPGFVETEMTERSVAQIVAKTGRTAEEARKSIESMSPQGRLIQPEEVAAAIVYLTTDAARGVNGQALPINGG